MKTIFKLLYGNTKSDFGEISFNGKFTFDLNESISIDDWNKVGFIKLEGSRHIESDDLFKHLNARLPIILRNDSNQTKLEYIRKSQLRVASDNFFLELVSN